MVLYVIDYLTIQYFNFLVVNLRHVNFTNYPNLSSNRKVTIHDIAKELNITAATVSRGLNGTGRISEHTRKRIRAAAAKFDYRPNSLASSLRSGKSGTIGVVVPTINRGFFSSVVRGIEEVAKEKGYRVIIAQSNNDPKTEVDILDTMVNAQVEGIFLSVSKGTSDFSHYTKIIDSQIKLIQFDSTTGNFPSNRVVLDDYRGAYMATRHLIDQGCKRIVHFSGQPGAEIYGERLKGYREALLESTIPIDERLIISGNLQLEDGKESIKSLLKNGIQFDGLFSSSDYAAMGAIQVLKEHDISIPDQVAVVGFMDEPFAEFTEPKLTSVKQFPLDMGKTAAHLFFKERDGEAQELFSKKIIQPELKIRASSLRNKS